MLSEIKHTSKKNRQARRADMIKLKCVKGTSSCVYSFVIRMELNDPQWIMLLSLTESFCCIVFQRWSFYSSLETETQFHSFYKHFNKCVPFASFFKGFFRRRCSFVLHHFRREKRDTLDLSWVNVSGVTLIDYNPWLGCGILISLIIFLQNNYHAVFYR